VLNILLCSVLLNVSTKCKSCSHFFVLLLLSLLAILEHDFHRFCAVGELASRFHIVLWNAVFYSIYHSSGNIYSIQVVASWNSSCAYWRDRIVVLLIQPCTVVLMGIKRGDSDPPVTLSAFTHSLSSSFFGSPCK